MKEIAEQLFITQKVVKIHLENIRKAIGVSNTPEMINVLCNNKQKSLDNLKLTSRGEEIFLLIIDGYTSKEIASKLEISFSAVRKHREKMLEMNNCTKTSQLILKYINP